MNKLLIMLLFPIIAFGKDKDLEPKFYKGQKIIFETGFFLHGVCSGKGFIEDYHTQSDDILDKNTLSYEIVTPANDQARGCPFNLFVLQKYIKAAE